MKLRSAFSFVAALVISTSMTAQSWAPSGTRIKSVWAESVSPKNAHPEYPRPQMTREKWQSLNGLWNYAITGKDSPAPENHDGQILVPFPVESSLSGVRKTVTADNALWYETEFSVPSKWLRRNHVMLNFEAVDWHSEVWVNDRYVGKHTGGYTHFSFDITPFINSSSDTQKLVVKVLDGTNDDFQPRGKQTLEPKGSKYTAVTGIWQSVWIEPVPSSHINDYLVVADIDKSEVNVTVNVEGARSGDEVMICLYENKHKYYSGIGKPGETFSVQVPGMRLWSPEDPNLYDAEVYLVRNDDIIDQVQGYAAMRKISVIEDEYGRKRLALNNKPLFQFGPLDQGWWPDGLYTAPTEDALKSDIRRTKDFGFNMIRKHVKVEPALWYYWCDKLGILVWQDMPSFAYNYKWGTRTYNDGEDYPATDAAKANFYKEWGEIISQLRNFGCIVVWVPFNEAWSQFDTEQVVAFTREQDATRLIDMASGGNWVPGCGDILDTHHYPEPRVTFWDPEMVNVIGEFGGIGYPVSGHLWNDMNIWGYVKLQSSEEVLEQYSEYAEKLKKLIKFGCSAAVYTQTTDVETEINGLITYDRKVVKVDEDKLREINESVIATLKQ